MKLASTAPCGAAVPAPGIKLTGYPARIGMRIKRGRDAVENTPDRIEA